MLGRHEQQRIGALDLALQPLDLRRCAGIQNLLVEDRQVADRYPVELDVGLGKPLSSQGRAVG